MTKIKLCGLSQLKDIETANQLKPDYVGFVFAPKSPRAITPQTAETLKTALNPSVKAVGVFVDEDPQFIAQLLRTGIVDVAQLHGAEDATYLARLRKLADYPVIQAFQIRSSGDLETAKESVADYLLLDSGAGTGEVFNWQLIKEIDRPYFLAGGLNPNNVALAIRTLHPWAVDVSSGIESGPVSGQKDFQKMIAFVNTVRNEDK